VAPRPPSGRPRLALAAAGLPLAPRGSSPQALGACSPPPACSGVGPLVTEPGGR